MPTIHQLIPQVISQVGAVAKAGENPQQHYLYRKIEDVVAALNPLFGALGLFVVPVVKVERTEQVEVGAKGTKMFHVVLLVEHTFYAADGTSLICCTTGEATDTGDKAANKAMTAAYKYALTETFCIMTADTEDTERDSPELSQTPAARDLPEPGYDPLDEDDNF